MEYKVEPNFNVTSLCIVGAGPGGLAVAASLLEEARKNPAKRFEIHVVEKRDFDFKRRQKIIITPYRKETSIGQIQKVLDSLRWDDYCQQLFDPHHQFQVNNEGNLLSSANGEMVNSLNEQQKFLRRIKRQPEINTPFFKSPINFSIHSLQKALKEYIDETKAGNVQIHWHANSSIEKVDLSNSFLWISKAKQSDHKQKIYFDHLIVCEGERRDFIKTINEEMLDKRERFKYKSIGEKSYHVAIRLTVKKDRDNDYRALLEKQRQRYEKSDAAYKSLCDLTKHFAWESFEDPIHIIDTNLYKESLNDDKNWRPRLFIAAEIPIAIHNMEDGVEKREAMLKWSRLFASQFMQIPEDCFEIDTKGEDAQHKRNALTFISDIQCVDNPVRRLPNGSHIVLVGDCAMSAYYPMGFSSTIAMNEAVKVAECIAGNTPEGEFLFDPLVDKYKAYAKMLEELLGPRTAAQDSRFNLPPF